VNAIAPGVFQTDLNAGLLNGTRRSEELLLRTPMRRFGRVEELVGAHLATRRARVVCQWSRPTQATAIAKPLARTYRLSNNVGRVKHFCSASLTMSAVSSTFAAHL
jgi:hypothetical protein